MALPILNDAPKYVTRLPSTGKEVKFRPFLVKEQKNLLIALESKDLDQIIISMLDCIEACSQDVNAFSIPTFDADYLFAQIRSKSVGETTEIMTKCVHCEGENRVKIDISSIKMDIEPLQNNEIELTNNIKLKLKYPTYNDMIAAKAYDLDIDSGTRIIKSVISCFDCVLTEDEVISFKDETEEAIMAFVESLTTSQLDEIIEFTDNLPKLEHEEPFTCVACGEQNTLRLEGLNDFFQ